VVLRHPFFVHLALVVIGFPVASANRENRLIANIRNLGAGSPGIENGAASGRNFAPKPGIARNAPDRIALFADTRGLHDAWPRHQGGKYYRGVEKSSLKHSILPGLMEFCLCGSSVYGREGIMPRAGRLSNHPV
jgi:hypothetical protein